MIKPLRTYHFFIWRVLAFAIPVVFVLAILWRPQRKDHHNTKNEIQMDSIVNTYNPDIKK